VANQIQATVYQIDGSPLSSSIILNFQTSNIVIREDSLSTIAQVQSCIYYYNVVNNQQSVQKYFVSEDISTLVSSANDGYVTQIQASVLEINGDPQVPSGIQYSFPANEILVGESVNLITGVNSYIQFKGVKYFVSETESTIFTNSNLDFKITNEQGVPAFYADTFSNIPSAGEVGRMFVSTDTYEIYRDNGISWDLIAPE
jgi:hypothetical protein